MPPPTITLTTDFGVSSPYVAQMKAVLLSRAAGCPLVDVTHAITPQHVVEAAVVLADSLRWFPAGSVHLAVVDPGVGTQRRIIAGRCHDGFFVGPDNGVFSLCDLRDVVVLDRPEAWLPEISATFHGRDIMAPVAAAVAMGSPLNQLGSRTEDWIKLRLPEPTCTATSVTGEIIYADSFGNLVTNLRGSHCRGLAKVFAGDRTVPLVRCYGQASAGDVVALVGSSGRLEIAVVNGNARSLLGDQIGVEVPFDHA